MKDDPELVLICGAIPFADDDIHTHCFECGRKIVYRPHAPKKAQKICVRCATKRMAREGGAPEIMVTEETKKELGDFLRKELH